MLTREVLSPATGRSEVTPPEQDPWIWLGWGPLFCSRCPQPCCSWAPSGQRKVQTLNEFRFNLQAKKIVFFCS